MDFRQLRYFVTTAEAGSILRAANELRISQPALSKRLGELEDSLGTKLFERHARGVNLTVAGDEFFRRAQEILESVQRMREAVIAAGAKQVRFRLGVTAAPAATLIPRLLERLTAQKLPFQFAIRQGSLDEIQHLLETGVLDGAVSFVLPARPERFEIVALYEEELFLVGKDSSPAGMPGDVQFGDLQGVALVLSPAFSLSHKFAVEAARRLKMTLDIRAEIEPAEVKRTLMLRDGLCTIGLFSSFAADINEGRFRARRIVEPAFTAVSNLIVHSGTPARLTASIRSVLANTCDDLIAEGRLPWRPVTAG